MPQFEAALISIFLLVCFIIGGGFVALFFFARSGQSGEAETTAALKELRHKVTQLETVNGLLIEQVHAMQAEIEGLRKENLELRTRWREMFLVNNPRAQEE